MKRSSGSGGWRARRAPSLHWRECLGLAETATFSLPDGRFLVVRPSAGAGAFTLTEVITAEEAEALVGQLGTRCELSGSSESERDIERRIAVSTRRARLALVR